jgi:hypothetical protein
MQLFVKSEINLLLLYAIIFCTVYDNICTSIYTVFIRVPGQAKMQIEIFEKCTIFTCAKSPSVLNSLFNLQLLKIQK